jgi:OmpA family
MRPITSSLVILLVLVVGLWFLSDTLYSSPFDYCAFRDSSIQLTGIIAIGAMCVGTLLAARRDRHGALRLQRSLRARRGGGQARPPGRDHGAHPNEVFLIEGHTDAVGSDAANLALSRKRAEAIKKALTTYYIIPQRSLRTVGYGERYLKIPTAEAEAENRRVSVSRATTVIGEAE